jgi:glutamate racemase
MVPVNDGLTARPCNAGPVGVFDSGVGGLSVLRAIRKELPAEHLLYAADSSHVPYGSKSKEYIELRAVTLAGFLLGQGAKAIVVACNTATAAAAEVLRKRLDVPVVAMEPALKPAAAVTRSGVVGVLATSGTVASARFAGLIERYGKGIRVVVQACPGLAERIEAGDLEGEATRDLVDKFAAPLLSAGADVIVLGCTHYPFIRALIASVAGSGVTLIDTGDAVAQQLHRVLAERGLLNEGPGAGTERFWTSGDTEAVGRVVTRLWGPASVSRIV